MVRRLTRLLLILAFALAAASPTALSQSRQGVVNVFTMWVQLSRRGLSQEEIESQLGHMDRELLEEVKSRLRRNVITNLEFKNIGGRLNTSRDSDDLRAIVQSVREEIRFAGLQNDPRIRLMIKDEFGLRLDRM